MTTMEAVLAVGGMFGTAVTGWLGARGKYRVDMATAGATAAQAETGKEAALHEQARTDHKDAVTEWQGIAEKWQADLKAYQQDAHDRLDKAHAAILGLLKEKADLSVHIVRLEERSKAQDERLKSCEDDRADLHRQLNVTNKTVTDLTAELTDLTQRLEKMEHAKARPTVRRPRGRSAAGPAARPRPGRPA